MGVEIERKFLVKDKYIYTKYTCKCSVDHILGKEIEQGYINENTRVRLNLTDMSACLTIKMNRDGIFCNEYNYDIPFEDAAELFNSCQYKIKKERHGFRCNDKFWELDIFKGDNEGLVW
jgi:CYTH domain-containing protein